MLEIMDATEHDEIKCMFVDFSLNRGASSLYYSNIFYGFIVYREQILNQAMNYIARGIKWKTFIFQSNRNSLVNNGLQICIYRKNLSPD